MTPRSLLRRLAVGAAVAALALCGCAGGSDEPTTTRWVGLDPRWSPDGNALLFTWAPLVRCGGPGPHECVDEARSEVWVADVERRTARRLVAGRDASWSPDGARIAYLRPHDDVEESVVAIVGSDGSGARDATDGEPPRAPPACDWLHPDPVARSRAHGVPALFGGPVCAPDGLRAAATSGQAWGDVYVVFVSEAFHGPGEVWRASPPG